METVLSETQMKYKLGTHLLHQSLKHVSINMYFLGYSAMVGA